MQKLPKLSYVLLSHNREKYIRTAIESAFAQDYKGELEYIFSDDCSTDRTFEIIKECVSAYKGGRRVVVTQPPTNQHLAGNTNHAIQFVESDWIVRADDDDLSSVDRCTIIGRAIAEHPEARFVATGVKNFTDVEETAILEESSSPCGLHARVRELDIRRQGFEHPAFSSKEYSFKAWHMDSFRTFGDLDKQAYYCDDYTCFFRCCILGSGLYIDNAPIVFARNGSGNMCRGGDDGGRGYHAIMRLERFHDKYYNTTYAPMLATLRQLEAYVDRHFSEIEKKTSAPFMKEFALNMEIRDHMRSYWRGGTLNRLKICREMRYSTAFSLLYSLPMPIYARLLAFIRKIKNG
ncbi:MAG: glycosyltransferase family 2 protein [Bacteroidales bacterium]|nr:glycosyltransferase family 2 protein [Candidatus Colimorpha merdihippi]